MKDFTLNTKPESLINKLSDLYFEPKFFEQDLYKILGVDFYKNRLWKPTWGKVGKLLNVNQKWIKSNSLASLENYISNTKRGELWHLVYTVGVYYYMGFTPDAHFVNLIGNYYPIMIQRNNRARSVNILKTRKKQKTKI